MHERSQKALEQPPTSWSVSTCLPKASTMETPTLPPSPRADSAARFRAPVLA